MQFLKNRNRVSLFLHAVLILVTAWHVYLTVTEYLANLFYTHDVGVIDYLISNTYHGRFFFSIDTLACFWSQHFTPSLLALVPLHFVFRHVLTIPILETLVLFSGAWAVAWMCSGLLRRGRKNGASFPPIALSLGVLYAANTFTASIAFANHFEGLGVGLMLWAFAALINGRKRLFWFLFVVVLGCKCDFPLYGAAWGAWWILRGWQTRKAMTVKKRFPLGIGVILVSGLWFLVAVSVMAFVRHQQGMVEVAYSNRYSWMGSSASEILTQFFTHPLLFLQPIGKVIWDLLCSVFFIPLLAPTTLLLLLPGACIMGLSSNSALHDIAYYYSYPFLAFLFLAVVLVAVRLLRFLGRFPQRRLLRTILLVFFCASAVYQFCQPTHCDGKYRLPEKFTARHAWIRSTLRKVIPPNATVAAQFDLLGQVPQRPMIYQLLPENLDKAEYWVLDKNGYQGNLSDVDCYRILQTGDALVAAGKAKILVYKDGFLILQVLKQ